MRTKALVLFALFSAVGCGGSPTNPPGPGNPIVPSGRILFTGCPASGPSNIYQMKPDGTNVALLVPNASDVGPSPDGAFVAFERTTGAPGAHVRDLFVATAAGANERQLTFGTNVYQWCWSPGGTWIVTNAGPPNTSAYPTWLVVWVADAAVDTLFANLDGDIAVENNPWSPDQSTLLYHENVPNTQTANIYALTVATGARRLIVSDGWDAFYGATADRIYFFRNSSDELWTATADGTDVHSCAMVRGPIRVSHDHTKIAFMPVSGCHVMQMTLGNCATGSVYDGACSFAEPLNWAPDGRFLLVALDATVILDTVTGLTRAFVEPSTRCGDYAWVP